MKKLLTVLGVVALLAAGCASQDTDNGMGGTSDTDVNMSGTTQGTTSQDTLKTDSVHSTANGGSQNMNGGTAGAPANGDSNNATSTPPQ